MSSEPEKAGDGFATPAPVNLHCAIELEDPRESLRKFEENMLVRRLKLEALKREDEELAIQLTEIEILKKREKIRVYQQEVLEKAEVRQPLFSDDPQMGGGERLSHFSGIPQMDGRATSLKEAPTRQCHHL
jgi:hypothetical protein